MGHRYAQMGEKAVIGGASCKLWRRWGLCIGLGRRLIKNPVQTTSLLGPGWVPVGPACESSSLQAYLIVKKWSSAVRPHVLCGVGAKGGGPQRPGTAHGGDDPGRC